MAELRKYGTATHIYKPIVKRGVVDFAVGADWTPAAGDVKISKDGGAAANVTNLPTAITMGNTAMWDYSLTATEMQAAQIKVTVADSATKAVEDQFFEIETYGNASAQHAADLSDSVRLGLTALPNQTPGASGGLLISGSNAGTTTLGALTVTGATTCTGNVSMAAGLTITQSTSNGSGIDVTGNGTGAGIKATSGSSVGANGISAVSTASVGGSGISAAGSNAGHGIVGTGGATGSGFSGVGGATSGAGIRGTAQAGNSAGMSLAGSGSSAGFIATGGATGHGINAVGGATSGDGLKAEVTSGAPIRGAITGDVTGNLSGSVGSVAAGGITAASFAAGAIAAAALAADALTGIADAVLKRDFSAVTGEAARSLLNAVRFIRNKWNINAAGDTLTVTKEDDTTTAWTATVSGTAGANPVTGVDPA